MLPDFLIAAPTGSFLARDVPVGVFFFGFPDRDLGADWRRAPFGTRLRLTRELDGWTDGLLSRVIVAPAMTPDTVRRLGAGADREVLERGYMRAIGWATDDEAHEPVQYAGVEPSPVSILAATRRPGKNLARLIKRIGGRNAPPHVVWQQWAISEFIFSWRVSMDAAEGVTKDADKPRKAMNDPDIPSEISAEELQALES